MLKKKTHRPLALSTATVRTMTQLLDAQLREVAGGSGTCLFSHACYTRPAGGCP